MASFCTKVRNHVGVRYMADSEETFPVMFRIYQNTKGQLYASTNLLHFKKNIGGSSVLHYTTHIYESMTANLCLERLLKLMNKHEERIYVCGLYLNSPCCADNSIQLLNERNGFCYELLLQFLQTFQGKHNYCSPNIPSRG